MLSDSSGLPCRCAVAVCRVDSRKTDIITFAEVCNLGAETTIGDVADEVDLIHSFKSYPNRPYSFKKYEDALIRKQLLDDL